MPEIILHEFIEKIKEKFSSLEKEIMESLDFSAIEMKITKACNIFIAVFLEKIFNNLFSDKDFILKLRYSEKNKHPEI